MSLQYIFLTCKILLDFFVWKLLLHNSNKNTSNFEKGTEQDEIWRNILQRKLHEIAWCRNISGAINFCITKCYLFKRRLKYLQTLCSPYKDIKGGTKKMILYLIAMWFCHSQVKYHFMRFVIMQKFVTEWVSATYLGFIVISMSWISSLQVTKESNYEMTNERRKKYTKIG